MIGHIVRGAWCCHVHPSKTNFKTILLQQSVISSYYTLPEYIQQQNCIVKKQRHTWKKCDISTYTGNLHVLQVWCKPNDRPGQCNWYVDWATRCTIDASQFNTSSGIRFTLAAKCPVWFLHHLASFNGYWRPLHWWASGRRVNMTTYPHLQPQLKTIWAILPLC